MSVDATRWAWQQAHKPATKLVLLALADRANPAGECWPSSARLVSDTGLDRKTIFASIGELETTKKILVSRVTGCGNRYKLLVESHCQKSEPLVPEATPVPETVPVPKTGQDQYQKRDGDQYQKRDTNLKEEPINNLSIKTIGEDDISSPQTTDDENQPDPVIIVFQFWQMTMHHPNAVFDNKRKSVIAKALKSYTIDQLKAAITGCAKSAYHMGQNDRQKVYDSLELIFRNADKIESFIQDSTKTTTGANPYANKKQQSATIADAILGKSSQFNGTEPGGYGTGGSTICQDDGDLPAALDGEFFIVGRT
ncbi:hypothetical protein CWO84_14800 [Methylomonas sp. Kb3]|uniref:helix-turn-helix domain-containing protein n=1 Tax=Methylomonas sp. Kb3 TaxID=1611544 RepID=UPI000C320CE0|nr:helix-turn-helix domain-containing protein [Methylomonas sp. Kb3]PKD39569.1 hypothetical protein CWO84_14800 [Methylomonas sp. Kb3]